jgi:hypothetical protein
MIGEDDGDVDMQFVALMSLKEISQTVVLFGDEHSHSCAMAGTLNLESRIEDLRDRGECCRNVFRKNLQAISGKFHPHEKIVGFLIRVMV